MRYPAGATYQMMISCRWKFQIVSNLIDYKGLYFILYRAWITSLIMLSSCRLNDESNKKDDD